MTGVARVAQRLFVLGATGGTGRALLDQALARGHQVTAFVRSPEKLGPARAGLTVVRGDPLDAGALRAALPGHDAVLSALGPPGTGPTTIAADGARAAIEAMAAVGVRRLLVVGVAVLFEPGGLVASLLRRTFLRHVARDSAEMERVVGASGLAFTLVRAPRLTRGPLTTRYLVADGRLPEGAGGGAASLSRADLAHFLLDELEHPEHLQRIVGVASGPRLR